MLQLFLEYYNSKDINLRNVIVRQNYNLARKVAHKAIKTCREPYEDLEQEAGVGLIKAVEKYNPTLGNAFSSFAIPYINGRILQYLRDKGYLIRLPQSTQSWEIQRKKALRTLEEKLRRTPTAKEIAEYLRISEKEYYSNSEAIKNTRHYICIDSLKENVFSRDSLFFPSDETKQINYRIPSIREELREEEIAILNSSNSSKKKIWQKLATMVNYDSSVSNLS